MKLLDCQHLDYHEGEKNVWSVQMPEFVSYRKPKPKIKDTISEMDEAHHDKFRKPENQKST